MAYDDSDRRWCHGSRDAFFVVPSANDYIYATKVPAATG